MAGLYPEEVISEVLSRTDIVDLVVLDRRLGIACHEQHQESRNGYNCNPSFHFGYSLQYGGLCVIIEYFLSLNNFFTFSPGIPPSRTPQKDEGLYLHPFPFVETCLIQNNLQVDSLANVFLSIYFENIGCFWCEIRCKSTDEERHCIALLREGLFLCNQITIWKALSYFVKSLLVHRVGKNLRF